MRNHPLHPGPLHAAGQKGGSVGQRRPSASRRLSSVSRALCASHVSRAPRGSHVTGALRASHTSGAPSSAGESGAGSGWVTRECAGGAALGGSGADFGRVTGESSAEAAAHPNAAGGDSVRPGKRCPSMARRTVSTRSACVILAARAAAPACASAGSTAACSRSMRSLSALSMRWSASARRPRVLGRHRLLARAEPGHRAERQRSQGLDRDEGAKPLGAGLARAHPLLGKAIGLALQADQALHGRGGTRTLAAPRMRAASCARDQRRTVAVARTDPRHDLVHGGAVLDGCSDGVLDCGRQRLVR